MRRAVPHFVAAAASLAPQSRASVGIGLRRHSGSSAPTEAQQTALLEHYAMGLREILAETDNLSAPAVVDRLRALRERAPVALERPFWGAQFLAMAFGHEMGFAAANPRAARAIFDLAAAAAERGLVPFQSVRAAHGQLKQLGLLTCDVVDRPGAPRRPERPGPRRRNNKRRACHSVVFVRVGAVPRRAPRARAGARGGRRRGRGRRARRAARHRGGLGVACVPRKGKTSFPAGRAGPHRPLQRRRAAATSWLGSRGTKAWPFRRHPLRRRSERRRLRDCPLT